MKGVYIERVGFHNSSSVLVPLKEKWRVCRVDDVFDGIVSFMLNNHRVPSEANVTVSDTLDIMRMTLFPPLSALGVPRITTTCRLRIEDPSGLDKDNYLGRVDYEEAYTLALNQEGFYGSYYFSRPNLLGSRREIKSFNDLWGMVDKHLSMGKGRKLGEWGKG
jgi:hypothetical protein